MTDPNYMINIDRLTLTGFDLSPERAERLRPLITVELQRRLAQARLNHTRMVAPVSVPPLQVNRSMSDRQLASHIAHGIAQSLGGK